MKATKSNNRWTVRVRYTGADGKTHQKRFTADKKGDCERKAAAFLEAKRRADPKRDLTFAEAAKRYIDSRARVTSPATVREYERALDGYYFRPIKDIAISDITEEDIQRMVNGWAERLSPKTIHDKHGFVSSVLRAYGRRERLNTTLPKIIQKDLYTPTDADIKKLLDSIKGTRLEAPVLISAFASLRRSEMCALTLDDIHDGYLTVTKAVVMDKDNNWVIKAPKTPDGHRVTYLPKQVTDRLREIAVKDRVVNLNPNQLSSAFSHAIKRAGLPHFRLHALRSYYASVLHTLGVPDKYIMLWGGWKDERTLQRHYQKAMSDKVQAMAEKGIKHFEDMLS